MTDEHAAEQIVYTRLLLNWPKADAILQLSLMEIAEEIVHDLRNGGLIGGPDITNATEKP